jgi:excisionase family DNA binding protein
MEKFFTVKEVSELLRVSESSVRNYVQRGIIKAIRIGTGKRATIRIPQSEIEALIGKDEESDES